MSTQHQPEPIRILVPEQRREAIANDLLSRRQALVAGGAGLLSLALAACGGTSGGASSSGTATPAKGLADKPVEDKLLIANWADYVDPGDVKAFERATKAKVTIEGFGSTNELIAKMKAGADYDIAVPSQQGLPQMIEQKLIRPLDHDLIPNLANLEPAFRQTSYDPGNKYSITKDWGMTSFYWRTDVVKESPQTLMEAFDLLPKYKGQRINFVDADADVIPAALVALGLDINSENKADYEKALALLEKVKPAITTFNSSVVDQMIQGRIAMGLGWNGDAARARKALAKKGIELQFLIPKTDGIYWTDNWVVGSAGKDPVAAHKWLNTMLDPKVAATEMEYVGYGIPVKGIADYAAKATLKDPYVNVPADTIKTYKTAGNSRTITALRLEYYGKLKA
jgi:spermidine/putrescine transport system substrate-binding protein